MDDAVRLILNVLIALTLAGGLFFMFVGALGVVRLPDVYTRSHAASKCVTLGIMGMLLALVIYTGAAAVEPTGKAQAEASREMEIESGGGGSERTTAAVTTKAMLVVVFVFVAAPIGSHTLARAAHRAGVKPWKGTLSDELAEDDHARAKALDPRVK
jgi:multicomponent Na+:H+ antiporter subunit G